MQRHCKARAGRARTEVHPGARLGGGRRARGTAGMRGPRRRFTNRRAASTDCTCNIAVINLLATTASAPPTTRTHRYRNNRRFKINRLPASYELLAQK